MKLCGYSVCPSDSHNKIKQIADIVLKTQGGKGVVRELLEDVLEIDLIKVLYKSNWAYNTLSFQYYIKSKMFTYL